jgi:hypothetical protein
LKRGKNYGITVPPIPSQRELLKLSQHFFLNLVHELCNGTSYCIFPDLRNVQVDY